MTTVPNVLPLPHAFCGEERKWYLGLAVLDEHVVPVVNPACFLAPETLLELGAIAADAGTIGVTAVLA
jgi:hypothetical protein